MVDAAPKVFGENAIYSGSSRVAGTQGNTGNLTRIECQARY